MDKIDLMNVKESMEFKESMELKKTMNFKESMEFKELMNFNESMKYMEKVSTLGSVLGLESTRELLRRLDNPQDKLQFVHIAGTNGKGSTAAFVSNIMAASGYRIGRYISPTIITYCERIQITSKDTKNNLVTEYITETAVAKHLSYIRNVINQMVEEGHPHPTPFEIETAMSFLEFVEQGCDLVVLEVGMGGRLDATNVIKNTVVAVLTSISMDHMQFLGNSLDQIAYEKAGIIKDGCRVVSYDQLPEARKVIEQVSEEKDAKLTVCNFEHLTDLRFEPDSTTFSYERYKQLHIRLLGKMQVRNAAVAITTVLQLQELGFRVEEENIRMGLYATTWRGRFEQIHEKPLVILDGAHNEDAAYALDESISLYFKNQPFIYIMGVLADKEFDKVLAITAKHACTIYTVKPNNSRGLPSDELARHASRYCKHVIDAKTVKYAIDLAMEDSREHGNMPILIFGSLSFHGEVYSYISSLY